MERPQAGGMRSSRSHFFRQSLQNRRLTTRFVVNDGDEVRLDPGGFRIQSLGQLSQQGHPFGIAQDVFTV